MEDVWPDSRDRTLVKMRGMHGAIAGYWAASGVMPRDQDQLSTAQPQRIVIDRDEWGARLRFIPFDASYCIWSAGPDGVFVTEDDLGVRGEVVDEHLVLQELFGEEVASLCRNAPGEGSER